jgi:hypothetical protein
MTPTEQIHQRETQTIRASLMTFRFRADATFEAENIAHAFIKLANHFLSLRLGQKETGLEQTGSIEIKRDSPDEVPPKEFREAYTVNRSWEMLAGLYGAEASRT